MKALLLTVTPELLVRLLNGESSLLVRKLFPKDYVGWVYLYCSKSGDDLHRNCADIWWLEDKEFKRKRKKLGNVAAEIFNGKVVARFWCDKVEEIYFEREVIGEICDMPMLPRTNTLSTQELIKKSCTKYLPYGETEIGNYLDDKGYAIHLTNEREESTLEIFDEPRELGEFGRPITYYENISSRPDLYDLYVVKEAALRIKKAPANYCWVEGEE